MAPARRKSGGRASAAAAAAAAVRRQWKVGDLVMAKVKGHRPWPATVTEPQKWGYSTDWKKVLVYFFGTKQIAFCNPADVEAFTEEKKNMLLMKRHGKGADFIRAVNEIIDSYEKYKKQNQEDECNSSDEGALSNVLSSEVSKSKSQRNSPKQSPTFAQSPLSETLSASVTRSNSCNGTDILEVSTEIAGSYDNEGLSEDTIKSACVLNQLRHTALVSIDSSRKRSVDVASQSCGIQRNLSSVGRSNNSSADSSRVKKTDDDIAPDIVSGENINENESVKRSSYSPDCRDLDLLVYSATVTSNSFGDVESEVVAVDSEVGTNTDNHKLEHEFKTECNGILGDSSKIDSDPGGKINLERTTVVLKRKRKQNRKPIVNDMSACSGSENMMGIEVGLEMKFRCSPNACDSSADMLHKADGDEHLPLVKRARARMGKAFMEEIRLSDMIKKESMSEATLADANPSADRALSEPMDAVNISATKICTDTVGSPSFVEGRSLLWKPKKYLLPDHSLVGEAALPPSKRLHRALKAMSAHVKEEADGSKTVKVTEALQNGFSRPNSDNKSPFRRHLTVGSVLPEDIRAPSPKKSPVMTSEPDTSVGDVKDFDNSSINSPLHHGDLLVNNPKLGLYEFEEKLDCPKTNMASHTSAVIEEKRESFESNEEHQDSVFRGDCRCPVQEALGRQHVSLEPVLQRRESFSADGDVADIPTCRSMPNLGVPNVMLPVTNNSDIKESLSSLPNQDMPEPVKKDDINTENRNIYLVQDTVTQTEQINSYASFSHNASNVKVVSDATSIVAEIRRLRASVRPSSAGLFNKERIYVADQHKKNYVKLMDDVKCDSVSSAGPKLLCQEVIHSQTNVLRSFEAVLGTLSRTKESISRATRLALDCGKYGLAGKALELLLRNLEGETSLHRRVDLFFLVDSITQCSRGVKGFVGESYLSAVQDVLPRLLSAAAPPGSEAHENRRQCLKVLRLWLERKTLPESIVRHHLQELDSSTEAPRSTAYTRHPSRIERALNDPLREMDGMLFDEYGSNTNFQIPGFVMPRMLDDDEDECGADEKIFEAVTPERDATISNGNLGSLELNFEKRCHMLEDVDGELEMEDVAPPCNAEVDCQCSGAFIPPLPEEMPPSPPPLPSSPPPKAPPLPSSPLLPVLSTSHPFPVSHKGIRGDTLSMQKHIPQSITRPLNCSSSSTSSSSILHETKGYRDTCVQIPRAVSSNASRSYRSFHGHLPATSTLNNGTRQFVNEPTSSKGYDLQPPSSNTSNHFSYVYGESYRQPYPRVNSLAPSQKSNFMHEPRGRNFVSHRSRMYATKHEIDDRYGVSMRFDSGPSCSEKVEVPYPRGSYRAPPVESSTVFNHGWPLPRRSLHYRHPDHRLRPPIDYPISRAPNLWRPR